MNWILDNGHGINTHGKCSPIWPDGSQLREYEFNRYIVDRIAVKLFMEGISCNILVPELEDLSLQARAHRANNMHEVSPSVLVSVHANAGGGSGWEIFTSIGNTKADPYATIFYNEVVRMFPEAKMRYDNTDGDPDKEKDFYLLKNVKCPAMITENFFMDNPEECKILLSPEGREKIVKAHVNAILLINRML